MSFYGQGLTTRFDPRILNVFLLGACIFFAAWTVRIWTATETVPSTRATPVARESQARRQTRPSSMASYNIISNKDIFRASRKRYVAPPGPGATVQAGKVNSIVRPPNLSLLGTVILDDGRAAIMSLLGMENDARFYKTGETIEGYTIKKIERDAVILRKGNNDLKVTMSKPAKPGARQRPFRVGPGFMPRR